ncbi:hypothetical protein DFH09DRAFT_1360650 [Mycena vulgaris]|nr:hypothetical protein DFH09DRAFT_1360650 [Mycena vulgaris]
MKSLAAVDGARVEIVKSARVVRLLEDARAHHNARGVCTPAAAVLGDSDALILMQADHKQAVWGDAFAAPHSGMDASAPMPIAMRYRLLPSYTSQRQPRACSSMTWPMSLMDFPLSARGSNGIRRIEDERFPRAELDRRRARHPLRIPPCSLSRSSQYAPRNSYRASRSPFIDVPRSVPAHLARRPSTHLLQLASLRGLSSRGPCSDHPPAVAAFISAHLSPRPSGLLSQGHPARLRPAAHSPGASTQGFLWISVVGQSESGFGSGWSARAAMTEHRRDLCSFCLPASAIRGYSWGGPAAPSVRPLSMCPRYPSTHRRNRHPRTRHTRPASPHVSPGAISPTAHRAFLSRTSRVAVHTSRPDPFPQSLPTSCEDTMMQSGPFLCISYPPRSVRRRSSAGVPAVGEWRAAQLSLRYGGRAGGGRVIPRGRMHGDEGIGAERGRFTHMSDPNPCDARSRILGTNPAEIVNGKILSSPANTDHDFRRHRAPHSQSSRVPTPSDSHGWTSSFRLYRPRVLSHFLSGIFPNLRTVATDVKCSNGNVAHACAPDSETGTFRPGSTTPLT